MGFVKYRVFHDHKLADELTSILEQNGIEYEISKLTPNLDSSFRGSNPIEQEIIVKIKQSDFDRVGNIWENDLHVDLESFDKGHYIFQFTDEELFDILSRPDEWSPTDYKLCVALLRNRGTNISDELLRSLKKQRLNDLSKTESSQVPWIVVGYFASILGGVIGLGIGWHLMTSKKILPDGKKVYSYMDSNRKHGRVIFYLAILTMLFWIIWFIVTEIV